ncbi:hypothetical protein KP509_16G019400 [Ceratopteris richardii]|uniref:Uncharacterized protein n=1 Tax=Ceratopteris richardii TaxID=49495 RepID=A0A8T2SZ30_CERRI|nr:hypothetical protein KP509_16G019400 [Ceratopteris richardii]
MDMHSVAIATALGFSKQDDEHDRMQTFEIRARIVRRQALTAAMLQMLLRFLRVASLTWATVVVLGGFVGDVTQWDFYLVTALLLAESFRLFLLRIDAKLLPRIPAGKEVFLRDAIFIDWQHVVATIIDFVIQHISASISVVCFGLIVHRLAHVNSHPFSNDTANLAPSLWIFYILAITNTLIGYISAMRRVYWRCRRLFKTPKSDQLVDDNSLTAFYDVIYEKAIGFGVLEATEVDLVDFAFRKMADDLKGGIHPQVVEKMNREMIDYLYNRHGGISMACEFLKGWDLWRRVAAASLPGFWISQKRIEMQKDLFWRLRDRMYGADKDAETAIRSVQNLAANWAEKHAHHEQEHPLLADDPGAGCNVVDTLVDLILKHIRPTLFFQVKALAACCRHPLVLEHLFQQHNLQISHKAHSSAGIPKDEIGKMLEELVFSIHEGRFGGAHSRAASPGLSDEYAEHHELRCPHQRSRLEALCMTLCSVIYRSNATIRIATRIYAIEILLYVLLHGNQLIRDNTMNVLIDMVDGMILPATDKDISIEADEIKAMETVRCWLSLEEFQAWSEFRVVDMTDGSYSSLSKESINNVVRCIREKITARIHGHSDGNG